VSKFVVVQVRALFALCAPGSLMSFAHVAENGTTFSVKLAFVVLPVLRQLPTHESVIFAHNDARVAFGHLVFFLRPLGVTGQLLRALLFFLRAMLRFSLAVILAAALAGRHAG
jgi:hypothetical protein